MDFTSRWVAIFIITVAVVLAPLGRACAHVVFVSILLCGLYKVLKVLCQKIFWGTQVDYDAAAVLMGWADHSEIRMDPGYSALHERFLVELPRHQISKTMGKSLDTMSGNGNAILLRTVSPHGQEDDTKELRNRRCSAGCEIFGIPFCNDTLGLFTYTYPQKMETEFDDWMEPFVFRRGQAHTFKPGSMGMEYDEEGVVKNVEKGGQADVMGIKRRDKIVKFALDGAVDQTYSQVALANAEAGTSDYTVTFLVGDFMTTQIWTVHPNKKFYARYATYALTDLVSDNLPIPEGEIDEKKQAYDDFRMVLRKLFGLAAHGFTIKYCKEKQETEYDTPIFTGEVGNMMKFLRQTQVQEALKLHSVHPKKHRFRANLFQRGYSVREKSWDLGEDEKQTCVVYTRHANSTFTCVKTYTQFQKDGLRRKRELRNFAQLKLDSPIERGKYGVVYRAFDRTTAQPYAVKQLLVRDSAKMDREREMIEHLIKLPHPCIVRFYLLDANSIVMEFCQGTIRHEIEKARQGEKYEAPSMSMTWIWQVYRGLRFLHGHRILHRDVKPDNVLVAFAGEAAKLADFGNGKFGTSQGGVHSQGRPPGTPGFDAPEVIQLGSYGSAADLHSFGVFIWNLLTDRPPSYYKIPVSAQWDDLQRCYQKRLEDINNYGEQLPKLEKGFTNVQELKKLVTSLLAEKPTDRPKHKDGTIVAALRRSADFRKIPPKERQLETDQEAVPQELRAMIVGDQQVVQPLLSMQASTAQRQEILMMQAAMNNPAMVSTFQRMLSESGSNDDVAGIAAMLSSASPQPSRSAPWTSPPPSGTLAVRVCEAGNKRGTFRRVVLCSEGLEERGVLKFAHVEASVVAKFRTSRGPDGAELGPRRLSALVRLRDQLELADDEDAALLADGDELEATFAPLVA